MLVGVIRARQAAPYFPLSTTPSGRFKKIYVHAPKVWGSERESPLYRGDSRLCLGSNAKVWQEKAGVNVAGNEWTGYRNAITRSWWTLAAGAKWRFTPSFSRNSTRRKVSDIRLLAGFVRFMAENVQMSPGMVKVLSYTVCRIEWQQGHWINLRFINRRLFQVETP